MVGAAAQEEDSSLRDLDGYRPQLAAALAARTFVQNVVLSTVLREEAGLPTGDASTGQLDADVPAATLLDAQEAEDEGKHNGWDLRLADATPEENQLAVDEILSLLDGRTSFGEEDMPLPAVPLAVPLKASEEGLDVGGLALGLGSHFWCGSLEEISARLCYQAETESFQALHTHGSPRGWYDWSPSRPSLPPATEAPSVGRHLRPQALDSVSTTSSPTGPSSRGSGNLKPRAPIPSLGRVRSSTTQEMERRQSHKVKSPKAAVPKQPIRQEDVATESTVSRPAEEGEEGLVQEEGGSLSATGGKSAKKAAPKRQKKTTRSPVAPVVVFQPDLYIFGGRREVTSLADPMSLVLPFETSVSSVSPQLPLSRADGLDFIVPPLSARQHAASDPAHTAKGYCHLGRSPGTVMTARQVSTASSGRRQRDYAADYNNGPAGEMWTASCTSASEASVPRPRTTGPVMGRSNCLAKTAELAWKRRREHGWVTPGSSQGQRDNVASSPRMVPAEPPSSAGVSSAFEDHHEELFPPPMLRGDKVGAVHSTARAVLNSARGLRAFVRSRPGLLPVE
mmetsp:Transcript_8724/g.15732  ORF Transcript_8724/g.15732 Transcript_8724/m.15732 type:complete len:566 (-) Transcript_8724:47-1744(-)